MRDLLMTQAPIQLPKELNDGSYQPYTITLARDVTHFQLSFFDPVKAEWLDEWKYTNQLPKIVQIALGLGNPRMTQANRPTWSIALWRCHQRAWVEICRVESARDLVRAAFHQAVCLPEACLRA